MSENEDPSLVAAVTAAVREADLDFESTGGSSRHYVRECLLPALERAGLSISRLRPPPSPAPDEPAPP